MRPIYPLIVTLEDWYIFGTKIATEVERHARNKLSDLGIDPKIVDISPFNVCSVSDFETISQILITSDINSIIQKSVSEECKGWTLLSVATKYFADSDVTIKRNLFPNDLAKIHPSLV